MHHVGLLDCPAKELACIAPFWNRTFSNFDAHLACGGYLYMTDHKCKREEKYDDGSGTRTCWRHAARAWAKAKEYKLVKTEQIGVLIRKKCAKGDDSRRRSPSKKPSPAKEKEEPGGEAEGGGGAKDG